MDTESEVRPASPKARDTGVVRMKFEMSDCFIHLWLGSAERWAAGPGGEPRPEGQVWPDWSALHVDTDVDRVAAVKCELKPESAREYEPVKGWYDPFPQAVDRMRKLRALVLDALEASDDVTRINVVAGGDGRAQFEVSVRLDEDPRGGRHHMMDPSPLVALVFTDDEDAKW